MTKVLAIALLAIRSAVRSRIVVVLLGLLLLSVVGLPLTVKGDGTLSGSVQVLLRYTLGFVQAILSIATLWAGCAAISQEIQDKHLHLIVTKPVHRIQIWLGKWLGLLILNAALLAGTGVTVYALLRWNTRPGKLTAEDARLLREEILVARRLVRAEPFDVDQDARQELEERAKRKELPPNMPPDQLYLAIRQSLLNEAYSVPAGFMRRWEFRLPGVPLADRPLSLQYRFSSSDTSRSPVAGLWMVGAPDRPDRFQKAERSAPDGVHTLQVPASMVDKDGVLTVDYANVNPIPITVAFSPDTGLELLEMEGGFGANYVRALLVAFFQLAFLGAIAVTAGSLFSLPVAALTSGYVVLLIHIGPYLQTLAQQEKFFMSKYSPEPPPGVWDHAVRLIYVAMNVVVTPFQSADPLELLSVGQLVSWLWVLSTLILKVAVGAGILALVSTWLFNRREIGLPT